MPQVGPAEILVILLVGLLVFGPKRLPEIGRQVGRAMREVKKFQDTVKGELDQVLHLQEDEDHSPPSYSSADAAIVAAEAPPALPAANGATNGAANGISSPDAEPAPRAQSRFRAPNGSAPTPSNGSTPTPAPAPAATPAPRAVTHRGARPPSRFRAPGPRPTT
jgi:TatA/E family protein of Tat protein translocase